MVDNSVAALPAELLLARSGSETFVDPRRQQISAGIVYAKEEADNATGPVASRGVVVSGMPLSGNPGMVASRAPGSQGSRAAVAYRARGSMGTEDFVVVGNPLDESRKIREEEQQERDEQQLLNAHIRSARFVSVVSVLFCGVFSLSSLCVGIADTSAAMTGLAAEFFLDGLTSLLVLWRFKTPKKRQFANAQRAQEFHARRTAARERKSGIGVGVTFVVSAVFLFWMAIWKLSSWDDTLPAHRAANSASAAFAEFIAWPAAVLFGYLAKVKFELARKLDSTVLFEDALCSALGSGMSCMVILAGLLEQASVSGAWRADPCAGIVISLALLVEGVRTLRRLAEMPIEKEMTDFILEEM